jgi:hypothetical protein
MSPIPSPEGACRDRLGHVGRERRPRRSGLARLSRLAGQRSRSSRGSPPPPLRHYDRSAQWGLKKRGWRPQTPCGSAGQARLYIEAPCPALPHPSSRPGHPGGGRRVGESRMEGALTLTCSGLTRASMGGLGRSPGVLASARTSIRASPAATGAGRRVSASPPGRAGRRGFRGRFRRSRPSPPATPTCAARARGPPGAGVS